MPGNKQLWFVYLFIYLFIYLLTYLFLSLLSSTKDWNWERQKEQPKEYQRILQCFLDRKDCCYSIHQMGKIIKFLVSKYAYELFLPLTYYMWLH
jgi:hypothetical protein